jgi:hypothetical protein
MCGMISWPTMTMGSIRCTPARTPMTACAPSGRQRAELIQHLGGVASAVAQVHREVDGPHQVRMRAFEGPVAAGPHLQADAQGVLQQFVALRERGESDAETGVLLLVQAAPMPSQARPPGSTSRVVTNLARRPPSSSFVRTHHQGGLLIRTARRSSSCSLLPEASCGPPAPGGGRSPGPPHPACCPARPRP